MNNDSIYSKPLAGIADFRFDAQLADVFSDMIQRSVPGYRSIICSLLLTAISALGTQDPQGKSSVQIFPNQTGYEVRYHDRYTDDAEMGTYSFFNVDTNGNRISEAINAYLPQTAQQTELPDTLITDKTVPRHECIKGLPEHLTEGEVITTNGATYFTVQNILFPFTYIAKRKAGATNIVMHPLGTTSHNPIPSNTSNLIIHKDHTYIAWTSYFDNRRFLVLSAYCFDSFENNRFQNIILAEEPSGSSSSKLVLNGNMLLVFYSKYINATSEICCQRIHLSPEPCHHNSELFSTGPDKQLNEFNLGTNIVYQLDTDHE